MNFRKRIVLGLFCLMGFVGYSQQEVDFPKREFRGVWIATVANIDWPKSNGDSVEKQQADFVKTLDLYKKLHYNAVIVQVRSAGDALYPTTMAPWSRVLTGKEGQAPNPFYDPLEWMISECHKRGMEFHAWFNPYRAAFSTRPESLSKEHDFFKHPEWFIKHGGKLYYNPALVEVQDYLTQLVMEVVEKYDIDAVHFDDYFYPYRIKGEEFDDLASYKNSGSTLSIADWRRFHVNQFVEKIYKGIKSRKDWVQFGISPFGVWRNKSVDPRGSDTQAGQTNYDDLYADPLAWMQGKYIDYILPQLYWSREHRTASYVKLAKWWNENTQNANLYIGNALYKIKNDSDKRWDNVYEFPKQIDTLRSFKNIQGNASYSAKWFVNGHQDVQKILLENQFKYLALPAVVPSNVRINSEVPQVASAIQGTQNTIISVTKPKNPMRYVVVYAAPKMEFLQADDASTMVDKIWIDPQYQGDWLQIVSQEINPDFVCGISFVDYYGNESEVVKFVPKR